MSPPEHIAEYLTKLPDAPGVYFFKDSDGETIYIGKAVSLKSRVRSYWNINSWAQRPKLAVMMPKVSAIETILTNSEKEALILEATLVRKHMPRYNVTLKDDKKYPWLAITYGEPFPRLIMVREPARYRKENPKARLFGPFVEAGVMWDTVKILRKVFPMRQRRKPLFKDRPCMNYYIGLCLGPCQKLVGEEFYDHMVSQVEKFLAGHQNEVVNELKKEMQVYSQKQEYEQAGKARDRLVLLEKIVEQQQVFFQDQKISKDVVAEAHSEKLMAICLLRIRQGKLISSESVTLGLPDKTTCEEAFQSFIDQYYTACEDISLPREILIEHEMEDTEVLTDLLSQKAKRQVKIARPERGQMLALIEMAQKNAKSSLEKLISEQALVSEQAEALLKKLQTELNLTSLPRRIECFDISNIQGTDNVASMVVFQNGKAHKNDYRHFKIRSVEGEANDFASMNEVVGRRYKRLKEEGKNLPDLIIIDGGKGQLNAAVEALTELEISDINIIGLAKKQEEVYLPGDSRPQLLPRNSEALHLLQRVRDEAHRFAVTFHRKLRAKRSIASNLDNLSGVGPAKRKQLLDHFGSFAKLKEATEEEIINVPKLSSKIAKAIYAQLHDEPTNS
jgi:excinuclease ABC subunit C